MNGPAAAPGRDRERVVLARRAAELSRPIQTKTDDDVLELLLVTVGAEQVALPLGHLREVLPASSVTRVPGANGTLTGLLGGHGDPLPVASLASLLGLGTRARPIDQWVVVLDDRSAPLGLLADSADDVVAVSASSLSAAPDSAGLVKGLAPGGVLVLDPTVVLGDGRLFLSLPRPMEEAPWDEA